MSRVKKLAGFKFSTIFKLGILIRKLREKTKLTFNTRILPFTSICNGVRSAKLFLNELLVKMVLRKPSRRGYRE